MIYTVSCRHSPTSKSEWGSGGRRGRSDESLEDSENLPEPDLLAAEIVGDLQAALDAFRAISEELDLAKALRRQRAPAWRAGVGPRRSRLIPSVDLNSVRLLDPSRG